MDLKDACIEECHRQIQLKMSQLNEAMQQLHVSLSSEDKSSAGDKHETGRAMVQLEMEKLASQIAENEKQAAMLERFSAENSIGAVIPGCLVKTNRNTFFIGVSLGRMLVNNEVIFAISPASPMAMAMMHKEEKDTFEFNGVQYSVLEIF